MTYALATYYRGTIAVTRAATVQDHRAAMLATGHHGVARFGVVLSWSYEIPEAIRAMLRCALAADAVAYGDHHPHAFDPPMDVRAEVERAAMLRRRQRSVASYSARKAVTP